MRPLNLLRLRPPRLRTAVMAVAVLAMVLTGRPEPAGAQEVPDRGEIRMGFQVGGTGLLSLITEYRRGDWSGELILGTISFREIGVAVSGKHYFGDGSFRPVVGLGLWSLAAWAEDGRGSIILLRAPLAVDWNMAGGHAAGLEVALNRALAVNRLDPEDDTPPNRAIIPIPGAYYRFGFRP